MDVVYAALLLHKSGKPVDEEGIKKVLHAIGASADEAKIKSLIASLKGVDIDKELENAAVVATAPGAGAGESKKAEEKKEEVKPEAAAEGLSALFG